MTEKKLIERLKAKDKEAFEELYNQYAPKIYVTLKNYVGPNEIEDALQEVFYKIFKGIHTFRGDSKLSTWIYQITINVGKDFIRKKIKNPVENIDLTENYTEGVGIQPHSDVNVSNEVFDEMEMDKIIKIMDKLSEEDKTLIKLRDIDGLSYDEIAKKLNKPLGSVKSRLHYARKKFQKLLKEEGLL
ncbi:RNA polymerase sigma 70 [Marinitoga sp. 1135]|uniref:RNA polymerase sigma factor, sigma-70 family n=1 Tax=Marinitoga piezophila (strain DSM 14283 / JCM 11233 / KA3) TaxID=443254 RepID=H2J617_MARPK|nr:MULTISPECIES: sigma-70 family RNA polymerase sigma factor [Marinitoga]AEX85078.1 RNA polymerase sigma factor, sigma-70 family [Marinitoga piezophila KA3]APT75585.1 RNA polymerase sigma 70 [Marinitoga sp. 1137]NUU95293.1 RNA polymerase sigma 70 [Marinitoga sp. 1135]NUU97227.1 RNA polymerase sigma 70 [Marinitoga sp. 1138]